MSCPYLPEKERKKLEQVFKQLDRNNDNYITIREFKMACSQASPGISELEVNKLAINMDIDGNGLIDLEEFCLCMARYIARKQQQKAPPAPKQSLSTKQLRDAFNYFDKDMSGSISQGELRQVMQTLGIRCNDAEFKALLDSVDQNGDGVVDFPEFCTLLNSIV